MTGELEKNIIFHMYAVKATNNSRNLCEGHVELFKLYNDCRIKYRTIEYDLTHLQILPPAKILQQE